MSGARDDKAQREVEELLKAAQDDVLLRVSANRHVSSSSLDPDLDRRFRALKVGKNGEDQISDDDLASRFQKLKKDRNFDDGEESKVPEDEVEKVMQWAMDAVRLEVISNSENLSGELEEDEESDLEDEESDSEGEERKKKEEKEKAESKKPPAKKWFFF